MQNPAETPLAEVDQAVARVRSSAARWAGLSLPSRIRILALLRKGYWEVAPELTRASCRAKGIPEGSPEVGQEWLNDPLIVLRQLRLLQESLEELRRNGRLGVKPSELHPLPDGRWALRVFPRGLFDRALLPRHQAWVHFKAEVTPQTVGAHQATFYAGLRVGERVCAVLGAGNVNAISPTDCLTKLFVEGTVCLLKTHPVNGFIGPYLEAAFKPLVELGAFAVISGGAETGAYLANHPGIDEVHVTGSDRTYDALVWGPPGPGREERKAGRRPLLEKPISSELGNITPVIVVPGPYSEAELRFQARSVAGMVVNNASFNCNAAKLLVVSRDWPQRSRFLAYLESALADAPTRRAYYPGAEERFARFTQGRAELRLVGKAGPGTLPWALIENVDPESVDELAFREEPWCAVLSETRLPQNEPRSFLRSAIDFVNERVWGTLCATVIAHPASWQGASGSRAWSEALSALRYGTVAVNSWAAAVFALGSTPWGAYPGADPSDIQSGSGWVHNTRMFEGIEKVVLQAPLRTFPAPPWFPGHRGLGALGRRLADFERAPSWFKLPGIATAALQR